MRPIDYLQKMQEGGPIYSVHKKSLKPLDDGLFNAKVVLKQMTDKGPRYYGGEEKGSEMMNAIDEATDIARLVMEEFPQDSIPSNMINKYVKQKKGLFDIFRKQEGGSVGLKPIPEDNKGLAKLPQKVRNKMGYMQEGGMVFETAIADNTAHSAIDNLIAENEMNQTPRTPFSFLDRDRIDRENQELMDIAMSAAMPMMGAMKIKKFSPKIMNMMAQLSKNPSYENNLLRRTLKGYNRLGSSKPTDEINIKNLLRYLESK